MDEAAIQIIAYDGFGQVIDTHNEFTSKHPELLLLEFLTNTKARYPSVTRVEMSIQY